jgi:hypothetical protein
MATYCGIDVGERKLFAAAIKVDGERLVKVEFPETETIDCVIDWAASQTPDAIAIDAPPGPNRMLLADPKRRPMLGNANRRVAEYMLGIGGCYGTPSAEEDAPGWMRTGFAVYRALSPKTSVI